MPKRKEMETSSPAKNMEHSGARPPMVPPSVAILALEAPNISAMISLHGRAAGRSGRGGRSGRDSISSRGGKSERGRGRGRRQRDQETPYHPTLRLPTEQQRKLLLEEEAREKIGIDLATMSMRRESSSTSRNNLVALTPEKSIPDQELPLSTPTVMIQQSEADEIEAFAHAPAPESGAPTQADPSIEPGCSGNVDKAMLPLKSLD